MSVAPSTCSEAMTVAASTSEKSASTQGHGHPVGRRDLGVEGGEQELLPEGEDGGGREDEHPRDDGEVAAGDAEDLAEEGGVEVLGEAPVPADQGDAEGEGAGGSDADRGVAPDLPPAGRRVDEEHGEDTPDRRTDVEADAGDERDDRPAEDAVRESVPDVGQAAQHDVRAYRRAKDAHERRGHHAAYEELELERLGQAPHR